MLGGIVETSASFEAQSAPRSYPTEPGLVGQLLQFDLPEPHSRTIRAAAVRRDCQFSCLRIARSSHAIVPATDRRHVELSRITRDPDADEAGVGGHIVP